MKMPGIVSRLRSTWRRVDHEDKVEFHVRMDPMVGIPEEIRDLDAWQQELVHRLQEALSDAVVQLYATPSAVAGSPMLGALIRYDGLVFYANLADDIQDAGADEAAEAMALAILERPG